jgi:hypothetical protein
MDEPKSLDTLFKQKIFRIPDYQRGYAWQHEQLKAFWEDLINLPENRSHYTGVLTLAEIPTVAPSEKEYWLVEDHSYHVYHVVDGQQRLTTFAILLQALVEFIKGLPDFKDKPETAIYLSESLNISELQNNFLFKTKPTGDKFRTYKFGYARDNPSYDYLRFRILGEAGGGSIQETFYTLNLSNAKTYFSGQFRALYDREQLEGLRQVYKKLTKRFLFNEYIIKDEFDVFVAFETMNNRGKPLSQLELLKNRLIYLTTLYNDGELDAASRQNLRETVNDAWKEVYHQLGRNNRHPLNDDEFLKAHWILYFNYSRKTGRDYIHFLLEEQFAPAMVHQKIEKQVPLEVPEEIGSDEPMEDSEDEITEVVEPTKTISSAKLAPTDIRDHVHSLKESSVHWFNSFYPDYADGMGSNERQWIERLNRINIGYFRPLVMAILKNEKSVDARIQIFQQIERFIFIAFRLNSSMASYGNSEFYNVARAVDRGEIALATVADKLKERLSYTFNPDGTFLSSYFYNLLLKKFKGGSGYYGWSALRYFLFEYESSLLSESRQKKVDWADLQKTENDRISIEHIYPQTETGEWATLFANIDAERRENYNATLGNLLVLSMSINASLQNDSFNDKKRVKLNAAGEKLRNGYTDGSHSEIEVSRNESWGPEEIKARGIKLLKFMEKRWGFRFKSDEERDKLLFLDISNNAE